MKGIIIFFIILVTSCSSNKKLEIEAVYYCRTPEWEHIYRIYEEYKTTRCMDTTKIRNGQLALDPMERLPESCRATIEKEAKKKRCCLVSKTEKYGDVPLPKCKENVWE